MCSIDIAQIPPVVTPYNEEDIECWLVAIDLDIYYY